MQSPAELRWPGQSQEMHLVCVAPGLQALDSICCNKSGISSTRTELTTRCRRHLAASGTKAGHMGKNEDMATAPEKLRCFPGWLNPPLSADDRSALAQQNEDISCSSIAYVSQSFLLCPGAAQFSVLPGCQAPAGPTAVLGSSRHCFHSSRPIWDHASEQEAHAQGCASPCLRPPCSLHQRGCRREPIPHCRAGADSTQLHHRGCVGSSCPSVCEERENTDW